MQLWQHQQDALAAIGDAPGYMLAMDMGTGKSATAIAALEQRGCQSVLILCPKSVASVWPGQFAKHAGQRWAVTVLADGTMKRRRAQLEAALASPARPRAILFNYDVSLPPRYRCNECGTTGEWHGPKQRCENKECCSTNLTVIDSLGKDMIRAADRQQLDALVLDESHRLKSASGKQSRLVSRLADRIPFRLALTGTPMPHSPLDVYAQFRALDKSIYGTTHAAFKARYAVMGGYQGHQVVAFRDLDDLRQRMDRVTYRCKAGDVLSLPEFTDVTYTCALDKRTRQVYDAMKDDFVALIEAGAITADNALVKLLRLAQIANGHATTEDGDSTQLGTEKRDLLAEVLDDLHGDYDAVRQEPVVVFTRFRPDLRAIREVARDKGLRDGELSGTHNDLQAWHDGDIDLLAVQLQAGGVGIDLTRARYCIYYSHDFSLGNDAQTRARVHRPGQTRAVTYIHLVAQDTIDEDIREALEKRADVVETVLAGLTSGVRA